MADTFWLFIFTLNRAKKWFNSIFNSKLNQKYSFKKLFIQIGKIHSKNYSIQNWIKNIHSNWKNNLSLRKQWKTCKMGRFFLKMLFLFIFLWISHFFYSFKNSFNSTAKIFIQRIYSFNTTAKYSFKEFIHSKNNLIIHSMKIFIFLKNAVSATPNPGWCVGTFSRVRNGHRGAP